MSEIGKRSSERGLVILLIDGRCDDEHSQKFIRKIITERGLTAMRNSNTLLRAEQSRAEQSRAEQSRAEQSRAEADCALFVPCGAHETEYNIRDG